MTPEQQALLNKAERSLNAAKLLAEEPSVAVAVRAGDCR